MKVGVKCEQGCNLANGAFEIHDHEGALAATGTLPGDIWPGTTGLYVSEVELVAPAAEDLYTWTVIVPSTALGTGPASEADTPHAAGSASFGIRVVAQPDYLVTIEAVDQANQAPLSGARIVMHPYRTVTDERGVARVRVAKGAYQLFVSQTRYVTFGLPIDVTAIGSAPRMARTRPSSASSPTRSVPPSDSHPSSPFAPRMPTAIGRSKEEPSFLTSAGARLIVVL